MTESPVIETTLACPNEPQAWRRTPTLLRAEVDPHHRDHVILACPDCEFWTIVSGAWAAANLTTG